VILLKRVTIMKKMFIPVHRIPENGVILFSIDALFDAYGVGGLCEIGLKRVLGLSIFDPFGTFQEGHAVLNKQGNGIITF
jgi:hypothetical protein